MFREFIALLCRVDIDGRDDLGSLCPADTEDIGQCDIDALVPW
jgi:hypothetical protein